MTVSWRHGSPWPDGHPAARLHGRMVPMQDALTHPKMAMTSMKVQSDRMKLLSALCTASATPGEEAAAASGRANLHLVITEDMKAPPRLQLIARSAGSRLAVMTWTIFLQF